jgi:hypothetical protein
MVLVVGRAMVYVVQAKNLFFDNQNCKFTAFSLSLLSTAKTSRAGPMVVDAL